MASINSKQLTRMLKALTKELGQIPTFEQFRQAVKGVRIER